MKCRKIMCISLLIVAMLFSVLSELNVTIAEASPASVNLNVTRYRQLKTKWCWAAAAQMIGCFLGGNKTQAQICKKVKGSSTINEDASFSEVVSAIKYAVGKNYSCKRTAVLPYGEFQTLLGDLEVPQAIRMQTLDIYGNFVGGHILVVEGYTKYRELKVIDPKNNGGKSDYNYVQLINGITTETGSWFYSDTFMVD